ncbi:MAG: DUF4388 domain-containing protein, partial [Deltaproteobacteria bacterium]|nr:DUF4388 domain-containing protein [Deltaproteobacteria bacterium]
MALKGNIETFYLSSIFQLLCGDKKTGVLTIHDQGKTVKVYFKNGTIVHATGTQKEVRLGYLLRTKGIISARELQQALAVAKRRKERLGKILVEKGFISSETLKRFIHQQVREVLYDLFLWKRGDFEYQDQEISLDPEYTTEFNHMEIILEGSRRIDEWALLTKQIPHPHIVFRLSKNIEQKKGAIELNANEWRILSLVDGKRSVTKIIADSGHEEYAAYRILNSLISSGLIEKVGGGMTPSIGGGNGQVSAIVQVYLEIFASMRKFLEKAKGDGAVAILEQAKKDLPAHEKRMLDGFYFDKDVQSNVQRLLHPEGSEPPPGKETLIACFNSLVYAAFCKQKEILDSRLLTAVLEDFVKMINKWQEQPGKSELQYTVLASVAHTAERFQKEVSTGAGKQKGGGL